MLHRFFVLSDLSVVSVRAFAADVSKGLPLQQAYFHIPYAFTIKVPPCATTQAAKAKIAPSHNWGLSC